MNSQKLRFADGLPTLLLPIPQSSHLLLVTRTMTKVWLASAVVHLTQPLPSSFVSFSFLLMQNTTTSGMWPQLHHHLPHSIHHYNHVIIVRTTAIIIIILHHSLDKGADRVLLAAHHQRQICHSSYVLPWVYSNSLPLLCLLLVLTSLFCEFSAHPYRSGVV